MRKSVKFIAITVMTVVLSCILPGCSNKLQKEIVVRETEPVITDVVITPEPSPSSSEIVPEPEEEAVLLKPEIAGDIDTDPLIKAVFPDWKGYTDDTLAMNSMFSFQGYHGQGELYLTVSDEVESFRMFVNGNAVDVDGIAPGNLWKLDISSCSINGRNTLQVSNIVPSDAKEAVSVYISYPVVLEGSPEEEGIRPETLSLISELIQTDIDYGFTSAQLSVIRNGRLVYENAWGKTNSYLPDGTPCTNSASVTTDTLYDLASVTKMFTVNYALQKLMTDGLADPDAKITDFLGEEFANETIQILTDSKGNKKDPETLINIETIKK